MKFRHIISMTLVLTLLLSTVAFGDETYPGASGWAVGELAKADTDGFITDKIRDDFGANITREEFCEIAVILYDRLGGNQALETDNPFTDTTNPNIIKAYNAGIVGGVGNNLFAPERNLTRQELCVMIIRAMTASGIVFGNENVYTFQKAYTDQESIASWAYLAVKIMNDFTIMNGSGDSLLPLNPLTREQAVIMLERAYLRDFTIEDNVLMAYTGNGSEIVIPSGITSINEDVFHNNLIITSVVIPSSVTTIGYAAFKETDNLTSITLNEGLITVGEAAFELSDAFTNITLPSTLQTIAFMGFQDCESLTEINLPAGLVTIDDQGFYSCESLGRVVFNNDTVTIGSSAFDDCPNVVFVCNPGSTADIYATENNITVAYK